MRTAVIACIFVALLPLTAWAAPRDALTRLILVPRAPGGELENAPLYPLGSIPPASFELFIDPELGSQDIEEYLAVRAWLLSAHYAVWLYRLDGKSASATPTAATSPTLVIEADASGEFPLGGAASQAGTLYAWQLVATLDGAGGPVRLWSTPLYFRTAPDESVVPQLLDADVQQALGSLMAGIDLQQRSSSAEAASLRGLKPYANYPSASDTYLCEPVVGTVSCPLSDDGNSGELPVTQLMKLGTLMSRAVAVQQRLRNGEDALNDARAVGTDAGQLQLDLPVSPQQLKALATLAERLNPPEARLSREDALSGLSQLIVALDGLIGYGTLNLGQDYQRAFLNYAAAAGSSLQYITTNESLWAKYLGADEAGAWVQHFEQQRAELALLTDEVGRGRLAKDQLAQRIAKATALAAPAVGELDYLEGASCHAKLERTKHLTAADAPQLKELTAQLLRCYLLKWSQAVWPDVR